MSCTQWYSGLNWASTCAHSGRPEIGKNVPAVRKTGVITVLVMYEK